MSAKRLALEVVYSAVKGATMATTTKAGREDRLEAQKFILGSTPSRLKARNAWLRAADIDVSYFKKKVVSRVEGGAAG